MGLAFSVNKGIKIPPSLRNIYTEMKDNYEEFVTPDNGCLIKWAKQGVLLLNDTLTVVKNKPNSHSGIGWARFTNEIISIVNKKCRNVVFMLWGSNARKKKALINERTHLVLASPHPSTFSADRGFFGCKHFSKANEYLVKNGKDPIKW
jgi:uracil-DNA glycosylase